MYSCKLLFCYVCDICIQLTSYYLLIVYFYQFYFSLNVKHKCEYPYL